MVSRVKYLKMFIIFQLRENYVCLKIESSLSTAVNSEILWNHLGDTIILFGFCKTLDNQEVKQKTGQRGRHQTGKICTACH